MGIESASRAVDGNKRPVKARIIAAFLVIVAAVALVGMAFGSAIGEDVVSASVTKTAAWTDVDLSTAEIYVEADLQTRSSGDKSVLVLGTLCSAHNMDTSVLAKSLNAISTYAQVDYFFYNNASNGGLGYSGTLNKGDTVSESAFYIGTSGNHQASGYFLSKLNELLVTQGKTYDYIVLEFDCSRLGADYGKTANPSVAESVEAAVAEKLKTYYANNRVIWITDYYQNGASGAYIPTNLYYTYGWSTANYMDKSTFNSLCALVAPAYYNNITDFPTTSSTYYKIDAASISNQVSYANAENVTDLIKEVLEDKIYYTTTFSDKTVQVADGLQITGAEIQEYVSTTASSGSWQRLDSSVVPWSVSIDSDTNTVTANVGELSGAHLLRLVVQVADVDDAFKKGSDTPGERDPNGGNAASVSMETTTRSTQAGTASASNTVEEPLKWTFYTLTTEVVNGTISGNVTNILPGESAGATYSPDANCHLEAIYVDGVALEDVTGVESAYEFTNIAADHAIKVVYAKDTYKLTADAQGGTIPDEPNWTEDPTGATAVKVLDFDAQYGNLPTPTLAKHRFLGWYDDPTAGTQASETNIMGTQDATIYAHWQRVITVSFDAEGGTPTPDQQQFDLGETATEPTDPTRENYVFGGWYLDEACLIPFDFDTAPLDDVTLHAKWVPVEYAITYELDGGSVAGTNPVTYNVETATFTLINPTREHYTFLGWTGTGLGDDPVLEVTVPQGSTGDREYTAHWDPINFTVSFVTGEGATQVDPQTVLEGSLATKPLPDPTLEGSAFAGWYEDPECTILYDFNTPVTGDKVLYARWAADATLHYDANGGDQSTAPADQLMTYPLETVVADGVPLREKYGFLGWAISKEAADAGTVAWEAGETFKAVNVVPQDATLWAVWLPDSHTVLFESNGGTAVDPQLVFDGDLAVAPNPVPTLDGYKFMGWYLDEALTVPYDFSTPVVDDVVLYAKWVAQATPVTSTPTTGDALSGMAPILIAVVVVALVVLAVAGVVLRRSRRR